VTFAKGQSGNPNGRMPGARGRATELVEKLMRDDAKDVVELVINAAKSGDMVAAKVVVDRLAPAPRRRFLQINVPKIEKPPMPYR
jgi:hypothetical protein